MRKFIIAPLVAGMLLLPVVGLATGTTDTKESTAVFRVESLVLLDVYPCVIDFGWVTGDDYKAGHKEWASEQSVTVISNIPWILTVKAGEEYEYWDGPEGTTKPCSDLEWMVKGGTYKG